MSGPGDVEGAYRSTAIAPAQIALGVVSGAAAAVILVALKSALWPVAVIAFVVAVGIGGYLAVVRVVVTPGRLTLGQGRGEREQRVVYASELISAEARRLSWLQCFGAGLPAATTTTRLSVRAGDTLVLITRADELLAVSTADARRALAVLTGGAALRPAVTPPSPTEPAAAPVTAPTPRPAPRPTAPPTTNPRPRPRPRTDDAG